MVVDKLVNIVKIIFLISLSIVAFLAVNIYSKTTASNIEIVGTGEAFFTPEIVEFTFTIEERAETVDEAKEDLVQKLNIIDEYLSNQESVEYNTDSFNVRPNYTYFEGRQNLEGYIVSQSSSVTVNEISQKPEEIVEFISRNGASYVGDLNFTLNDETMKELRKDVLKQAVKDAKSKAREESRALGVKLGGIVFYERVGSNNSFVRFAAAESTAKLQFTPAETKIVETVRISFRIR